MNSPSTNKSMVLDEVMLAMDVVDTLRHRQDLVLRELSGEAKEKQLIKRLREIYSQQGIEVPDNILKEGVAALNESRFTYEPPKSSFKVSLAKLYVSRSKWGRWVLGSLLAIIIGSAYYQFIYVGQQEQNAKQAIIELNEIMPAKMEQLYQSIFDETKVQSASSQAKEILDRGKIALKEQDKKAAQEAINKLTKIRDQLRQEYSLTIVNREGVQSGFWTFPEINTDATNYYLVVEALDKAGNKISLPILNEETGKITNVDIWGIRVSEELYANIASDKRDDGIIQQNILGKKTYGYLDATYNVSVLGGAVTEW